MSESPDEFAAKRRAEYVEALKVEREGYVRSGKDDRVKAVDDQLRAFGAAPKSRKAPSADKS